MNTTVNKLLGALLIASTLTAPSLLAQAPKKGASKPFLIQGKLPHLTMLVKQYWDDRDVAFTKAQKEKLVVIRKETVGGAQKLGKEINALESSIVKRTLSGAKPSTLKESVEKLALLRAAATMIHIKCIYNTKKVLTQDQLDMIE